MIMASDSTLMYYDKFESSGKERASGSKPENPQIRLSPEEIRVLKECNRESFYYRSLPMALTAMAATHLAVKRGFLTPHPKWGSAFKQFGAALIGWFLGKISYRTTCEDKFLHLQNSAIADMIRKKRGYVSENLSELSVKSDDYPGAQDSGLPLSDSEYHSSFGSLNLDVDKNVQYSGLDDKDRPSVDSSIDSDTKEQPPRPAVTYDELRRRNRDIYEQQFRPQSSGSSSHPAQERAWSRQNDSKIEGQNVPKNKYGDVWER